MEDYDNIIEGIYLLEPLQTLKRQSKQKVKSWSWFIDVQTIFGPNRMILASNLL